MDAHIDRALIARERVTYITNKLAFMPLKGDVALRALQDGHRLTVMASAGSAVFALNGSGRAMAATEACARSLNRQAPGARAPADERRDFEYVPYSEAVSFIGERLKRNGIADFAILPKDAKADDVIVRFADGMRGIFRAARGQDTASADQYSGLIIARLARSCSSAFLATKSSVSTFDGSVVRKVMTTCQDPDRDIASETRVTRLANGLLLEWSLLGPTNATPPPEDADRHNRTIGQALQQTRL
jgi:hypothetical protein